MKYFLLINDYPEECTKEEFYYQLSKVQGLVSKNKHLHILVTKIENDVSVVNLHTVQWGALKILVGFIEDYK